MAIAIMSRINRSIHIILCGQLLLDEEIECNCIIQPFLGDTALVSAAQRLGVQPPRARCIRGLQNCHDLAREAVGWNTVLGGTGLL
jgi:hypothetical protein